jgi:hypothetical protein
MHIIIKEVRHTSGKVSPHFWNAEELKYQLTFSPFTHDYPTLEMAQKQCPEDAVIVSELSRHDGAKKTIATYQKQFPAATNLICLRRRKDWVVYGKAK